MRVFLTLFALVACAYSEVTVSRITSDKFKDIRLPTDVVPERYRLQILPVLEEGNFSTFGEVEIDVLCKEKTNRIVLHATTLEIDENSVSLSLGKTIPKRDVIFVKQRERFVPKGRKISKSNNEAEENFKDEPELKEMVYDETKETVTFVFDSFMKSDERYTLRMDFRGSVPADLKGFYRSSFVDKAGTKKWLAVTQFEPTDARRAFPCFDEPAMKATFEVSLGRKEGMTTVTNMPLIRSEAIPQRPGWIWDHYEKTVPMSTYLVAFLVSDFEYRVAETYVRDPPPQIEAVPDEMSPADAAEDSTDLPSTDAPVTPPAPQPGPVIRVWTRHDAMDQAGLALNVTPSMLSFLEKYFDIHYPLPKLDLVGLPDFAAGAMENWGLITYRERAVLYDPERSSAKDKLYVQKVIAHELAHQWFGNLVTMKWWTDLWLNEGFATYVQGLAIHHVEPEWDYPSYFALEIQDVLGLDSLESSHPVSVEVLHPDQIAESFDTISYKKGASVIRMMNFFLGEPTFRQGLTNYLNEKKYDNAEQDDLWQSLTDQAHKDGTLPETMTVKAIMDTWTLKKGYPVVMVNRNYKDGSATLTQKRFLLNPESEEIELPKSAVQEDKTKTKKKNRFASSRQKSGTVDTAPAPNTIEAPTSTVPPSVTEAIDYSWWVPITATGGAQADFNATKTLMWMSPEQKQLEFKHKVESSQWLIVNVLRTGFFRVNYDSVNWQLLINQLRADHTRIHPVNRAQLLDDAYSFAAAGELPYTTALELSRYLVREHDTVPMESFLKDWRSLANIFKYTPEYGLFKKVQTKLLLPTHMHRGFLRQEGESGLEAITRASVVSAICSLDAPECVETARDLYKQWMNVTDPDVENPIQSDVSGAVYCAAIRHGGEEEWDFLKNRVSKVNIASQRDTMLAALGCTREPWLLLRYINAAFVDSKNRVAWGIRKQDWRTVATSVAGNPVGRSIIAEFVKERWDDIQNFYGSVLTPLRLLQTSVSTYSTPIQLEEVRSFIASKAANLTTALGTVRRILDNVATNVNWKKRHYATVSQWLEKEAESSIVV